MGPEQNIASPQSVAPAPAPTPEPNMMAQGVSAKKGKGMLYGMILLGVLAVGGIGFGVWTMMDSNSQKETLNAQISTLKQQNNELQNKVAELESTIENSKKSENGTDEKTSETATWSSENAEVKEGAFYIKDSNGEILAQSVVAAVTGIVSCEYLEESTALKCTVTTADGEGWFLYNTTSGILTSSFDSE